MLNRLINKFELLKNTQFPHDTTEDELSLIHAELVEYDGYVVGLIDSLIVYWKKYKGEITSKIRLGNQLEFILTQKKFPYDYELEERIKKIGERSIGDSKAIVEEYLNYLFVIKDTLEEATKLLRELDS